MHRFFLPQQLEAGQVVELREEDALHATRVLRMRPPDMLTLLNGQGQIATCQLQSIERKSCSVGVEQVENTPPPPHLSLILSVLKGKAMDWALQKAVELAAVKIQPIAAERTVAEPGANKVEKWTATAIEAVKQCGCPFLPNIQAPIPLSELLANPPEQELNLTAALHPEARHPRQIFDSFLSAQSRSPHSTALIVGPEGDFTADELEALQSWGSEFISLGSLVLRAETAVVAGLAVAGHELRWLQKASE